MQHAEHHLCQQDPQQNPSSLAQMFYIWYGDKWDLSYKDYSSTPKILTGAPRRPMLQ